MIPYKKPIEVKEESFAHLEHQRRTLGFLVTAVKVNFSKISPARLFSDI
jgi:hypothetical protein